MKKIPCILNVDTGIDDAVAIAMSLFSPNLDVKLIVCSIGNNSVENISKNTQNLLHFLKKDVPVVIGQDKPLHRPRQKFLQVHGATGMGEYDFPKIKYSIKRNYISAMKKCIEDSPEKISIISIASLTNIAKLIIDYPEYKNKINEIVFMSGSIEKIAPNEVPYMEFNGAVDPESCEVVINSGIPLLMCPMECGHTAYLTYEDVYKTKYLNRTGAMFEEIFRSYKDRHVKNGIATHDGCAVACLIDPSIFKIIDASLAVKYFKETGTGVIMCDFEKKPTNAKVCVEVDTKKFIKLYFKLLKKMV